MQSAAHRLPASSDAEIARAAEELLRRRRARESLLPFTEYTYPRYEAGYPHHIIAESCDMVLRGDVDRLMIMAPPRHGKTELATRRLPALALGQNPSWQVIGAASTKDLAEDNGRDVRNIIRLESYERLFDTRLAGDSTAKGKWDTSGGGSYFAAGVGSATMGKGGDLVIIDDPFASWEDAQSALTRKQVGSWYTSTIYNRLANSKARIVVINHRMHEEDLCGQLDEMEATGEGDKWTRVKLEAINEGLALWPERFSIEHLERIRAMLNRKNPMAWFALYQQKPTAPDGVDFKREWFRYYDAAPSDLNIYMAGDFAVTEAQRADFTELGVFGVDPLGNIYVLDWWYGQKQTNEWIAQMVSMFKRWKPIKFIGESGVIRRASEPYIRKEMSDRMAFCSLEWVTRSADKVAMAAPFQALVQNGRFYLPRLEWAERLVDQLLKFPVGRHDDAVDACANLGLWIADMWAAAEHTKPKEPDFAAEMRASDLFRRQKRAAGW